jgi:hypothetical protein
MARYIGELRSVGLSPMSDELKLGIRGLRDHARVSAVRATLLSIAAFVLPLIFASLVNPRSSVKTDFIENFLLLPLILSGWIIGGFAFRCAHHHSLWRRELDRDIRTTEVETFTCRMDADEVVIARINPFTSRLLELDGRLLPSRFLVHLSDVAERPTTVSGDFPPLLTYIGTAVERTRMLSDWEREEIERLASAHPVPSALPATYLSSLAVALLLIAAFGGGGDSGFAIAACVLGVVCLALWSSVAKSMGLAKRIRNDGRAGVAQQVAPNLLPPSTDGTTSARMEILPASRLIWTINDEPADWRKAA